MKKENKDLPLWAEIAFNKAKKQAYINKSFPIVSERFAKLVWW